MKIKHLRVACMALLLSVGLFSSTALVYADGVDTDATAPYNPSVSPTPYNLSVSPTPTEQTDIPTIETQEPLTPDGNLTLIDDDGTHPTAGKQFITVQTKSGNYFYLIIDRDDEGKETVHFLNQVDEADLMKLMDEKELEQLAPEEPKPEPTPEPTPETETQQETPEQKPKKNFLPAALLMLALAGGGGFFLYKKLQEKKAQQEQEKPDPDADYTDDEDYGYLEDEDLDENEDELDEADEDTVI